MTRTHFNSSSLIRTLAELEVAGTTEAGAAFAEKLGQWVSFTDAIALSAALNPAPASAPATRVPKPSAAHMANEVTKVRASLAHAITQPHKLPEPPDTSPVSADSYEPYRRFYAAHQRDMQTRLAPLRAKMRTALSHATPALQQLATLDAALETSLRERESKLLAKVATLLQKRFVQLLQSQDGAWLARFGHELQTVLLAELDLRLQPTLGLLQAYQNDIQPSV